MHIALKGHKQHNSVKLVFNWTRRQFSMGFMTRRDYFAHFEASQSVGAKTGDPEKNHLSTRKQNLAYLT